MFYSDSWFKIEQIFTQNQRVLGRRKTFIEVTFKGKQAVAMIIENSRTEIHDKITYTHVIKFVAQFRSAQMLHRSDDKHHSEKERERARERDDNGSQ